VAHAKHVIPLYESSQPLLYQPTEQTWSWTCEKLPVSGLPHSLLYNVSVLSLSLSSPHIAERLYEGNIVVTTHNDSKTGQLTRQIHSPY